MESSLVPVLVLLGLLLTLVDSKGTFYGNPYRYNMYKAGVNPHYNAEKPLSRHKNHCAYIVQRNITCTIQDGMETYVKPEYTTRCIWGQTCPVLMYRTYFKPKYKIGHKMVTELEWRCCPGFTGENCIDSSLSGPGAITPPFKGSIQGPRPGIKGYYPHAHPRIPPEHTAIPGPGVETVPFPGDHGESRPIPTGQLSSGHPKTGYGPQVDISGERLDRMEEDIRRLSQGLDTLNGMEDRLRVSLREDTTKMLMTLLGSAPRLSDPTVGVGVLDSGEGLPVLGELVGRVTEVKDQLRDKSTMLEELRGMVLGHDGHLKKLMESANGRPIPASMDLRALEEALDARLAGVRAEFDKRLTSLEIHCNERIEQVQQECHQEQLSGQSLEGREADLKEELQRLKTQVQGLTLTEVSLSQRVQLLEEAVRDLTESQRQLQVVLTEQTLHMEGLLDARLVGIEGRINVTKRGEGGPGRSDVGAGSLDGFNPLLDKKLRNLEERLILVVEELSNATAPSLLEGQVVPALETEIENMRRRVETELDGLQNQLTDLELLCTSTCSPAPGRDSTQDFQTEVEECKEVEKKLSERLDAHSDMLERLNRTMQGVMVQLARDEQDMLQGEITLLKINVNSVNRTLKGLRDSVHLFTREVGHANSSWQTREQRLSSQVRGVAEQVGRQASLLGAGERRLIQLKGELQGLRHQLESELHICRGTALGVRREVMGVESRVSRVEGQCGSLSELGRELERIRAELESHSDTYLAQVNGTLASHTQQLAQLKDGLEECVSKADSAQQQGDQ
ncbi:EMILIN-3 [Electrophorus electricus]|uniref:EMILIN-3 n=1 Tax=Electrophorus electricus TaxID=8005 RepID=UPI0015CFDC16|nr:EMILIN-3 [Electrophorus electricus]